MNGPFVTGLSGRTNCAHVLEYYRSAEYAEYEEVEHGTDCYAVCTVCGLHVWNVTPPADALVIDLDDADDTAWDWDGMDAEADAWPASQRHIADEERLKAWMDAVKGWE